MKVKKTADIVQYRKEYYAKNKLHILDTMNRTSYCSFCCEKVRISKWDRHCRSQKHQRFYNNGNELKPSKEIQEIKSKKIIEEYIKEFGDDNEKINKLIEFIDENNPVDPPPGFNFKKP